MLFVKKVKGEKTHVFQGTEPIFEKKISAEKTKSYVYALGKYLARVDGVIGDPDAKKYFYHTDHVGSIRAITDQAGEVVYNADYFAFGTQFAKDGDFEELHGFTGKEYDPDIGLYYFNARWYDPDLGRFISEDPARDAKNPNLYSYCGNNPINRIDPTGKVWWWLVGAILGGLDSYLCGGDFMQGAIMGAATGALGAGVNTFVNTAWGALGTFGTQVVSGAIAGGITGEMFGEGFAKGAVFGAIGGAINVGVDNRFGGFASKSTFNKVLVNGLKGGLNGLVRGGDFIEGFAYGFVYGYAYEYGEYLFTPDNPASDVGEPNGSGEYTPILDMLEGDDQGYYYSQRDPEWADIIYSILDPTDPRYPQTIRSSGCGPTSAAMGITKLTGERVTPVTTAEYALANGYRTEDSGTSGAFFGAIGKEYGLTVKETTNFYEAKRYLKNNPNSVVVASMGRGHFTGTGHYIVLDSAKSFLTTKVLDPNSASKNHSWLDLILAHEGNRYYIFTKP